MSGQNECLGGAVLPKALVLLSKKLSKKILMQEMFRPKASSPQVFCIISSSRIHYPRGSLEHHKWFCNQFPPFSPVLHCPLGLGELQSCPFPDVFPPLPRSALSSSPFNCALQDGFGQTWWIGDMTIPLQFASLYGGQEVFVWSDCLLDLGTDLLGGNIVFVWDA